MYDDVDKKDVLVITLFLQVLTPDFSDSSFFFIYLIDSYRPSDHGIMPNFIHHAKYYSYIIL